MFELLLTVLRAFTKFSQRSRQRAPQREIREAITQKCQRKGIFYQISNPVSVYLALVRRREHPLSG